MLRRYITTLVVGASLVFTGSQALAATYQVKSGDTLWKLAQQNGISVSSIQAANPQVNPINLRIGQAIEIPGITAGTYTVKQNDTFWTISRQLHVSVDALQRSNPSVNPLNLYAGLRLHVPKHTTQSGSSTAAHKKSSNTSTITNTAARANTLSTDRPTQLTASTQGPTVTIGGQVQQVAKQISGSATAYTASAASNGSWGAYDYFGNPLKLGTIAVDPNVIPLGSKVYVTGYSFDGLPVGGMIATAADVGGGIKGSHIDIFIPTSDGNASNFGIQSVKLYVLK